MKIQKYLDKPSYWQMILVPLAGAAAGAGYLILLLILINTSESSLEMNGYSLLLLLPVTVIYLALTGWIVALAKRESRGQVVDAMAFGLATGTLLLLCNQSIAPARLWWLPHLSILGLGLTAYRLVGRVGQLTQKSKWAILGSGAMLILGVSCSGSNLNQQAETQGNGDQISSWLESLPAFTATELVTIPAGPFLMGADLDETEATESARYVELAGDESPQHEVYLDTYSIERTEVTIAQYASCARSGPCTLPEIWRAVLQGEYTEYRLDADHPATYVSWQDANEYCTSIGRRLPTEAEWEKAARGPDGQIFPWGNEELNCELSNFVHSCAGGAVAVGSYPESASPYGVLDMSGNVREWVADWYDSDYYSSSPGENPAGPEAAAGQRVVRGTAFFTDIGAFLDGDGYPESLYYRYSTFTRTGRAPADESVGIGFRCVEDE